jgi:uncharacterized membrane protein
VHAERICRLSYLLLAVLLIGWYAWWAPSGKALIWSAALMGVGGVLLLTAPRGRLVWGGMVVLLTFIHGTTDAMVSPPERVPALLVVMASLVYFGGLWLGIRAARQRR